MMQKRFVMLLHYSDEINRFYNKLFSWDDKIGHNNVGMLPKDTHPFKDKTLLTIC